MQRRNSQTAIFATQQAAAASNSISLLSTLEEGEGAGAEGGTPEPGRPGSLARQSTSV